MAKIQLSDAEWKVMNAIWRVRGAVTVRAIHGDLAAETAWAYSTVKTLMERLVDKGALKTRPAGVATEYQSTLPRQRAQRAALRDLMRKAFGGALGPMAHSLLDADAITSEERGALLRKLQELDETP